MGRHLKLRNTCMGRWALGAAVCMLPLAARAQVHERISRSDLKTLQDSFADIAEGVMPSVVAIRTKLGMRPLSQGSGVIFRSNGYILTNYHVIEDAERISVILHNGLEFDATVMQVDDRSDLAVITIDADDLHAASFTDLEHVRIGHWTFAIGNPFGLSNFTGATSFSVGNVSSIGRSLTYELATAEADRYYGNLIETTAAINPGNSGGPLFNVDGKVIGVVAAIETRSGVNEGVGFAIPITKRTRRIIETLSRGEEVRYGYLGIELGSDPSHKLYTVQGKRVRGSLVRHVKKEQPAHIAGLQDDDVIVELDGAPIEGADHVIRVIGGVLPGEEVRIRYVRSGRERTATAELLDREVGRRGGLAFPTTINWRGAEFRELTEELMREHGVPQQDAGIVVLSVRPASDAARRGLAEKQMVMSVNGTRVTTMERFRAALSRADDAIKLGLYGNETVTFPGG